MSSMLGEFYVMQIYYLNQTNNLYLPTPQANNTWRANFLSSPNQTCVWVAKLIIKLIVKISLPVSKAHTWYSPTAQTAKCLVNSHRRIYSCKIEINLKVN